MSTQTTDLATIISQLSQLLQGYQTTKSQNAAAQIAQLAQEWLAADPTANSQLKDVLQRLTSADPQFIENTLTSLAPQLQQQITQYQETNPSLTQVGTTVAAQQQSAGAPVPNPSSGFQWQSDPNNPSGNFFGLTPTNGVSGTGDQQILTETVDGVTTTLNFNTAQQIIDSALQTVGIDPNALATSGINVGQSLGNFFWSQIVNQGITDPTTIGDMISTLLPSTGQFQVAFPGYAQALANGYVRTVADYVSAEEGITAVMLQGGVPKSMINPTTVGDLISNGVSVNEAATRITNGLDAAMNAPAEVQSYFEQEFGAGNGVNALATVFLNPDIDSVTLQKMLAGAQVRGAFAASNLTVSQGLSQRLADQGVTYASAQQAAKTLNSEAGLFQQTVGEAQSQRPVPGTTNANRPLDINDQGIQAVIGDNAADAQQVHQAGLARTNEFRGGGGASTTEAEGFSGLAAAKPY